MATISGVARPAYVYDAANNQWVPIGVGPHTHSLADLPSVVSTNGGSTITTQGPTIKGLVIQGSSGQTANLFEVQNNLASVVSSISTSGALYTASTITTPGTINASNLALGSYGQVTSQNNTTGISVSGSTSYPNGGTIVYRGDTGGAGGTATNGLEFFAGSTERMRITNAGLVGINNVNPDFRLDVTASPLGDVVGNQSKAFRLYGSQSGNTGMLEITQTREAAGAFWIGSGYRIQQKTDATWQGYIQFNGGKTVDNAYGISFGTGGNSSAATDVPERMRIDSNGCVGIGGTSASSATKLFVTGPSATNTPLVRITHTDAPASFMWSASMMNTAMTAGTNNIIMMGRQEDTRNCGYIGFRYVSSGSTQNAITFGQFAVDNVVNIDGNGYLLAGYLTSNGAYRLQVNSQIFATSSSIATSDARYKENVEELTDGLDMIKSLRPVEFNWKPQEDIVVDDKIVREAHAFPQGKTIGFIAQEVQEALANKPWINNLVKENLRQAVLDDNGDEIAPEEDFLGIAETNLIAVLVSAVKELTAKVEALEAKLA